VRHQGKPLLQPTYNFRDVPFAAKGFAGSTLSEITDRQHFVDSIAELTLLCSEASRRRKNHSASAATEKKITSKPLSIEYIFDRIDTDDPLWGYMLRTDTPMSATGRPSSLKASPQWRRGMLQGFISVTTFTTWKSSFRFDSLHEEAFAYDDVVLEQEMKNGLRVYDKDGALAQELEQTVHGGDPYVEGIVYPRIAEISLLGGLGCGKQLLKLAIERLECLRPTSSQNYEYVVLQATENSIPFYESMGFTRVGCIQGKAPSPTGYSSSPVMTYVVKKEWEKPMDIAKQFGVDVLDLEFLNVPVWGSSFRRNVWLKKGTEVFVPWFNNKDASTDNITNAPIKWYTAKENETPKGISMKFKVKYADFIAANQKRYPTLAGNSRLKEGTRIQISRFDIDDSDYMPYPHWTFPDDELDEEAHEPSYMMAMKLNRKSGKAADLRPVADSLAVPIQPYSPDACGVKDLLMEPKVSQIAKIKPKNVAKELKKPKKPPSAFMLFCTHARTSMKHKFKGKSSVESSKLIGEMWKEMSQEDKDPFYKRFEELKPAYAEALKQYEKDLATFHKDNPQLSAPVQGVDTSLLEQVVKLKSKDGLPSYVFKYEYFYVLTYIPDLLWVHLIPMRKVGVFDVNHPTSAGRPIWMIVSEEEGKEFDASASICKPVLSRTINNSADADDEQWDVYESGDKPPLAPIFAPRKSGHELSKPVSKSKSSLTGVPCPSNHRQQSPSGSSSPNSNLSNHALPAAVSDSRNNFQKPQSMTKKCERKSQSATLSSALKLLTATAVKSECKKRKPPVSKAPSKKKLVLLEAHTMLSVPV
ncbi:hypothetical protein HJC23_002426, partial [Cyclotella cryptica]